MQTLRWSEPDSNRRSPQEGTGSPAALIESVSRPAWPTAKKDGGTTSSNPLSSTAESDELASPSRDVVLWLSGYYNGKRNNTIIAPQTIKKDEEQVDSYCYDHRDATVLDAIKNVLGLDK